jgi:hypothetical protein
MAMFHRPSVDIAANRGKPCSMPHRSPGFTALCLAAAIAPICAYGHGRSSSAVAADVTPKGAIISIDAVVLDLMQIGDVNMRDWRALSQAEREQNLHAFAETMVGRFRLVQDGNRMLQPEIVKVEMPDFATPIMRRLGLDQQSIPVSIGYTFTQPPASLTFWHNFAGDPEAEPIYAQFLIRRNDNMVMLPTELGPGFLVTFPFDWETEPVPLAHRRSLRDAACGWQNRPANARLEVGATRVSWTVYVTTDALFTGDPQAPKPDPNTPHGREWSGLRDFLRDHLSLQVDGRSAAADAMALRVYPQSAMALGHDRRQPAERPFGALVEIELSMTVEREPAQIDAVWSWYKAEIPMLYCEVLHPREALHFSFLTPQSPALQWRKHVDN